MEMPVVDPQFSDEYDREDWDAFLLHYHDLMKEIQTADGQYTGNRTQPVANGIKIKF